MDIYRGDPEHQINRASDKIGFQGFSANLEPYSLFLYGQIHHFYKVCDLGKAIYDFIAEQSSEKEGCMQSCIFYLICIKNII